MRKYGDPIEKEMVLTAEQRKRLAEIMNRPIRNKEKEL